MPTSFKIFLERSKHYALLLIALMIPVHARFTGGLIGLLLLLHLLSGDYLIRDKRNLTIFFCFIALYLCYLAGMLYTEHSDVGWKKMQLRISMVILPWIFLSSRNVGRSTIDSVMKAFIAGGVIVSLFMLDHASFVYLEEKRDIFFSSFLTDIVGLNPSYMAMYFTLIVLWLFLKVTEGKKSSLEKTILWSSFLFFFFMLTLLGSRTSLITTITLLFFLSLFHASPNKRSTRIRIGVVVTLAAMLFFIPTSQKRFSDLIHQWNQRYSNDYPTSMNMRMVIYQVSEELILKNPILGLGTGDVDASLFDAYRARKAKWPLNDQLNAHNQFVQTTLALGIVGLTALILLFYSSFRLAVSDRNKIYLVFLAIILIYSLTESIFETEGGVVFFSFFNSLLAAISIGNSPWKMVTQESLSDVSENF